MDDVANVDFTSTEGAGWNEGGDTTDNRGTAANGASGGDNWNGADTAATNGNDFDAVGHDQANGELTENGSGGGGDFTCRRFSSNTAIPDL